MHGNSQKPQRAPTDTQTANGFGKDVTEGQGGDWRRKDVGNADLQLQKQTYANHIAPDPVFLPHDYTDDKARPNINNSSDYSFSRNLNLNGLRGKSNRFLKHKRMAFAETETEQKN
ncbi:hypothetical protein SUGI_0561390 [Cryptomeria japonica]|nr:hypothetical protein SUGI_0561390 [Cryptomeria japonica]